MNSLFNLVRKLENKKSMEYCSVSNCLTFQSGSDGNTVRLLNVSNIRIVKKQQTFFVILVPVVVCLIVNQFYLFPFAKSSVVLYSAFLFFFKSKPTCTLLVNYHNVSFQEIPLKSSDLEDAKRLIESFLDKKQKAYLQ